MFKMKKRYILEVDLYFIRGIFQNTYERWFEAVVTHKGNVNIDF